MFYCKIDCVRKDESFDIPQRSHSFDAGYDLKASISGTVGFRVLNRRSRFTFSTNIRLEIPEGYVGLIHSRSGLASKKGLSVLNAPGVIDAGYLGEIMVVLQNHTSDDMVINHGDRIAQLLFSRVEEMRFVTEPFSDTERGANGCGSTGVE